MEDLSSGGYGISLINDRKYGHRVKNGIISLNLLRSPIYPDRETDRGEHSFRYALYLHKGDFTGGNTLKEGYHFNMAQVLVNGRISLDRPVTVNQKNIVIKTIKKAERDEGIMVQHKSAQY